MRTQQAFRVFVFVAVVAMLRAAPVAAQSTKATSAPANPANPRTSPQTAAQPRELLDRYCVMCHNQRLKSGGLLLDQMDLAKIGDNARVWEEVIRKLRGGLMPPPGVRRPQETEIGGLVTFLETSLDQAAQKRPDLGYVALHRLNRTEYASAVEDLLGVRVDPSVLLPVDDISDGFDNIANVLKVSPAFLDQYISAARAVTGSAIGDPALKPVTVSLKPPAGGDQNRYVEGLPLGTRGGFVQEQVFPADAEYEFTIPGMAFAGYVQGFELKHRVILTIDGEKVFENSIGGEEDLKALDQQQASAVAAINKRFEKIRVPVKAGSHKVGVTFVARGQAESDDLLQSFVPGTGMTRIPKIPSLDVAGPYNATTLGETPARKKIFVCRPPDPREELPCANRILSNIAKRAYRRPLTERDLAAPLQFFKQGRERGNFDTGIQDGLIAILASPKFLYRAESVPSNVAPGATYRISDLELATRLSFFLWSQGPDDKLIDLAVDGKLHEPAVLTAQVRRMLSDPRAKSLVTNFAFEWLNLRALGAVDPDPFQFPGYDKSLGSAFQKEMELFLGSIFQEDRTVTDILSANYTFVNERLAKHYGISGVQGAQFQRVQLADRNRWGLLGKGAFLMVTSYPNRTSTVLRGAYILERLIGAPPSPPPPNVEAFPETKDGAKVLSVRQRMELHRKNPSCNACHGIMDPLGFALENYDAVGEWRTMDRWAGAPIDSSGQLVDGTPVNGPADLRAALVRDPAQFARTMTEKLLMYALGRQVEPVDMPVVRRIVSNAAKQNYRFSSIVMGIVNSGPFQLKQADAPESKKVATNQTDTAIRTQVGQE
jgi:mono/diheme cytochrome c family protein